jgi:hypothetical protein
MGSLAALYNSASGTWHPAACADLLAWDLLLTNRIGHLGVAGVH